MPTELTLHHDFATSELDVFEKSAPAAEQAADEISRWVAVANAAAQLLVEPATS